MNLPILLALALAALTAFAFGAFALYHRAFDRRVRRMGERISPSDVSAGDVLDIGYVSTQFGWDTVRRTVVSVEDGTFILRDEKGREYEWRNPDRDRINRTVSSSVSSFLSRGDRT